MNTRRSSLLCSGCWLLLLLGLFLAVPAWGGGFHISILGVRRTGMMTNLANPDDVTALFHNPAGLADLGGTQLHLSNGMSFIGNEMKLQELDPYRFPEINPGGCPGREPGDCPWPVEPGRGGKNYYQANITPEKYLGIIPYLGASHQLSGAPGQRGLTVSLAAYAPGAYGAYLPEDAPTAYFVIEGLFVVAAATAGVGWRLNEHLALGASVSYNYLRLGYAQKFSLMDVIAPADASPTTFSMEQATALIAQGKVGDLRLDYTGTDSGLGWGIGVLFTPTSRLSIGLGYAGFTSARFQGDLRVRGLGTQAYFQEGFSEVMDEPRLREFFAEYDYKLPRRLEVEMPIPPAFMAGVSLHLTPRIELGLDLRYWLYRLFQEQTIDPRYDQEEPGKEPLTRDALSHDKRYSDSFEVALGLLVRPLANPASLELMCGVAYDQSPVPDETFSIDNPSMNQAIVSLGVRSLIADRVRLGAAYMLINYLERDITTSEGNPPTNVRISGRSHIPTVELEVLF